MLQLFMCFVSASDEKNCIYMQFLNIYPLTKLIVMKMHLQLKTNPTILLWRLIMFNVLEKTNAVSRDKLASWKY